MLCGFTDYRYFHSWKFQQPRFFSISTFSLPFIHTDSSHSHFSYMLLCEITEALWVKIVPFIKHYYNWVLNNSFSQGMCPATSFWDIRMTISPLYHCQPTLEQLLFYKCPVLIWGMWGLWTCSLAWTVNMFHHRCPVYILGKASVSSLFSREPLECVLLPNVLQSIPLLPLCSAVLSQSVWFPMSNLFYFKWKFFLYSLLSFIATYKYSFIWSPFSV